MSDNNVSETDNVSQQSARFSFRLTDDELSQFMQISERLQKKAGKHTKVTQKYVFLEALDALEKRLNELERTRKR